MSWKISKLNINGVKGVLNKSGDFNFKNGQSIAIFAPNGCGKSGYADALEYLFSLEGYVEHLGKGHASSEHGGKHALPHVLAVKLEIPSEISVTLKNNELRQEISLIRSVKTGNSDPIPSELKEVVTNSPAHRVLRQHDLRRFVVDMTPGEKYTEISRWLGLEHLEEILSHLTTAQNDLISANPDRQIGERLRDIRENTDGCVTEYDPDLIFCWCTTQLQKYLINEQVSIQSIEDLNLYIKKIEGLRDQLTAQVTASSQIVAAKRNLEFTQISLLDQENGSLSVCRQNLIQLNIINEEIHRLRDSTKEAIFQDVWESSSHLLTAKSINNCPVCLTPWDRTDVGSQKNACIHLTSSLSFLTEYRDIQTKFDGLHNQFKENLTRLMSVLRNAQHHANLLSLGNIVSELSQLETMIGEFLLEKDILSKMEQYNSYFQQCQILFSEKIPSELSKIRIEEIPDETNKIQSLIDKIKKIEAASIRLDQLDEEIRAFVKVNQDFDTIAGVIRSRAGDLVKSIIQSLKEDIVRIYKKIQATDAVPDIIIEQDGTEKAILLRVNFYSKERVPPAGYLSESQINTLGLALFICAVKTFNREFPFIVLDDVVSSYDADHRARIVDVIAEELSGFQVFLTTHDGLFYNSLKMRLSDEGWQFDRITSWELNSGPKKQTDLVHIDHIKSLIDAGNPQIAGNALRQYIEEWLDKKCAEFDVRIVHKRPLKEYDRTIFDFWNPFDERIKELKGDFFKNQIENKDCYTRLKTNPMLNYYSHWRSNPYEWGAIGDVQYVFIEFQAYQNLFNCYSCKKPLKFDRTANRVYCTCGKQFLDCSVPK